MILGGIVPTLRNQQFPCSVAVLGADLSKVAASGHPILHCQIIVVGTFAMMSLQRAKACINLPVVITLITTGQTVRIQEETNPIINVL